ncbi:MAG: tripartite tricarboxylate transporter substrate binding protein [Pseudomonadota bacterium]
MICKRAIVLVAAISCTSVLCAHAQTYKPTRPIEFVVHTGPGGGNDVFARAIANMTEQEKLLPVRMQVVNKPGGGSITGMAYVAERKGESNTIAAFANTWVTAPMTSAETKVSWKELTPIVLLVTEPALIAVKADSPHKTLKDLIESARKSPGKLRQSGGSPMSRDGVVRAMLQKATGTQWAFISFPGGGERIAALLGGHVDFMMIEAQEAGEHIRNGNLRVIAQVADNRLKAYANVPTIKEAGFDIPNYAVFRGVTGPPGMPRDAVAYYEDYFARLVKTAVWKKYLDDNFFDDAFLRSGEFAKFIDEFAERTRPILKDAGVKVYR